MAAVQGIVLTAVVSGVLPRAVAVLTLLVVATLLVESFGREAWWLWRGSRVGSEDDVVPRAVGAHRG